MGTQAKPSAAAMTISAAQPVIPSQSPEEERLQATHGQRAPWRSC